MKHRLFFGTLLLGSLLILGCANPQEDWLGEATALYEAGRYADAISALEGCEQSEAALALMANCEAALLQQAYDAALGALQAGDYGVAQTAFLQLGDYLDAPEQAENARLAALEEQTRGLAERIKLLSGQQEDLTGSLFQLMEEAELLKENPGAAGLYAALFALSRGDGPGLLDAVSGMDESPLSREDWEGLISACLPHRLDQGDEALSLLWAWNTLSPLAETGAESEEEAPDETEQSQQALAPLHAVCWDALERGGKAPAGKILVYATRRHYASQDQAYYDLTRMRQLTPERTAENPEEADYIVHIAYDYKRVGRFTTYYNRGVLEFADVTLIDTATGKKVGARKEIRGPMAKSLETAKITSEFVSGGPPDEGKIDLAVHAALERALTLLTEGEAH